MYEDIKELDLIAKEFKMHDHCRKSFLKGFGEKSREKLQLVSNAANFLLYLSPSLSLPQTFNIIFSFLRNTSKPQKRNLTMAMIVTTMVTMYKLLETLQLSRLL